MSSAALDGDFNGWKFLREASPEEVSCFPKPIVGQFVIALEPPTLDGIAEMKGEVRYVPPRERLALLWENRRGKLVLHETYGFLLMNCKYDATWLPSGWEADTFPIGWTLPHLERWFNYALDMASIKDRSDIPPGSEMSPSYAPLPRDLVTHAHLILRHLGLLNSPTEPRQSMDRAGCLAELRDILVFLQRTIPPTVCEEHLPKFHEPKECLAYLKQVTPDWPPMGIDWPLVLCKAEELRSKLDHEGEPATEAPRPGEELADYLGRGLEAEYIRQADPIHRSFAFASSLLEAFIQLDAFCTASLAIGYDLDAIPAGCDQLTPYHALMCLGWTQLEHILCLRNAGEADFLVIDSNYPESFQVGSSVGKNAHAAVLGLAREICELRASATEGKLAIRSMTEQPPGTIEHAWARLSKALEGRLPDAIKVKQTLILLETESRAVLARAQSERGRRKSAGADTEADESEEKFIRVPENKDVCRLAKLINKHKGSRRPKVDIAREFTESNEKKAQSLLRKLRDYPHLLE